jgi:hypothetical protein
MLPRQYSTDRTEYPKPDTKDIPKSKWRTHIISHLLEPDFEQEITTIIRGLKANTFHAIYVTLFGKGSYYSLGSQFLVNNEADITKIMQHLNYQYELLQTRYDLSPTQRSLVKVRELQGYSSQVNEFFFDQMDTDPFAQPYKESSSIKNEIYYPNIDLSAPEIVKDPKILIIEETISNVIFVWGSKGSQYYIEFDKINKIGTSSKSTKTLPFEDTKLSNGSIKRESQGFSIIFNPETRKVINYYYHTRVDELLGTKILENPSAFPELTNSQEIVLGRPLTPADTKPLTKSSTYAVLDIETIHSIRMSKGNRELQDLEIVSAGFYTSSEDGESSSRYYQITDYKDVRTMVSQMLKDLSELNLKYVYVHNWAGFDSLFLLQYLENEYHIDPFTFDGNLLSLRVSKKSGRKLLYTIKDSLKLLPLSQGDLTKSFEVETQKGSFPHYFDPREHSADGTMKYVGPLPGYEYFESSRTTPEDYAKLQEEYTAKLWDYEAELKKYQMDDCKSLIHYSFFPNKARRA